MLLAVLHQFTTNYKQKVFFKFVIYDTLLLSINYIYIYILQHLEH